MHTHPSLSLDPPARPARLAAGLCAIVLATGCLLAPSADAGDRPKRDGAGMQRGEAKRFSSKTVETRRTATGRERDTTWTGADGRTATRRDVTTRTDNGYTRSSVATGPAGNTATREAVVERDREAGVRTRQVTSTGPRGGTSSVSDVITRTDTGYTREVTRERTPPADGTNP